MFPCRFAIIIENNNLQQHNQLQVNLIKYIDTILSDCRRGWIDE
jgi:hypothetical protein